MQRLQFRWHVQAQESGSKGVEELYTILHLNTQWKHAEAPNSQSKCPGRPDKILVVSYNCLMYSLINEWTVINLVYILFSKIVVTEALKVTIASIKLAVFPVLTLLSSLETSTIA